MSTSDGQLTRVYLLKAQGFEQLSYSLLAEPLIPTSGLLLHFDPFKLGSFPLYRSLDRDFGYASQSGGDLFVFEVIKSSEAAHVHVIATDMLRRLDPGELEACGRIFDNFLPIEEFDTDFFLEGMNNPILTLGSWVELIPELLQAF